MPTPSQTQIEKKAAQLQESLKELRVKFQELQAAQAQCLAEIHGHEGALTILQQLVSEAPGQAIDAEVV